MVAADIITPKEFIGAVMDLCQDHRGIMGTMEYISTDRVEMHYRIPLAEIISTDRVEMHYRIPLAEIVFDFFDQLKSRTKGYASLDYHEDGEQAADLVKVDILIQGDKVDAFSAIVHRDKAYSFDFFDQLKSRTKGYASLDYHEDGEQAADLVKVDILIQGDKVDAFSAIVHRDKAYSYGVMMTKKLRELIPRQQFCDDDEEAARTHSAPAVRDPDPGGDRLAHHRPREHPRPAQGRARQMLRRDDDEEAARTHSAPAVRDPDPGGDRLAHHRPREHPRPAQGRARQMLRRRHHPQAQAARKAEGRQEAHEDAGPCGGAAGGVRA